MRRHRTVGAQGITRTGHEHDAIAHGKDTKHTQHTIQQAARGCGQEHHREGPCGQHINHILPGHQGHGGSHEAGSGNEAPPLCEQQAPQQRQASHTRRVCVASFALSCRHRPAYEQGKHSHCPRAPLLYTTNCPLPTLRLENHRRFSKGSPPHTRTAVSFPRLRMGNLPGWGWP